MDYQEFLKEKTQLNGNHGFGPIWMPDFLFDFQKYLVEWSLKKGRGAMFADCGMGKTPMQLVWADIETGYALSKGIPVVYSIDEIQQHL